MISLLLTLTLNSMFKAVKYSSKCVCFSILKVEVCDEVLLSIDSKHYSIEALKLIRNCFALVQWAHFWLSVFNLF